MFFSPHTFLPASRLTSEIMVCVHKDVRSSSWCSQTVWVSFVWTPFTQLPSLLYNLLQLLSTNGGSKYVFLDAAFLPLQTSNQNSPTPDVRSELSHSKRRIRALPHQTSNQNSPTPDIQSELSHSRHPIRTLPLQTSNQNSPTADIQSELSHSCIVSLYTSYLMSTMA